MKGFECALITVIPAPRKCYKCQRFRHFADQCRLSRAICEYCSGHHSMEVCPNGLRAAHCSNCFRDHIASSRDCSILEFEIEIIKHCFWNNCSFREAEVSLTERGIVRPLAVWGPDLGARLRLPCGGRGCLTPGFLALFGFRCAFHCERNKVLA